MDKVFDEEQLLCMPNLIVIVDSDDGIVTGCICLTRFRVGVVNTGSGRECRGWQLLSKTWHITIAYIYIYIELTHD